MAAQKSAQKTAEDLSPEELQAQRAHLERLRDELQETLTGLAESSKPVQLDQQAVGRISRVDAIQQQQMAKSHERRAQIRLQQVNAALSALDRGQYGWCNVCEEPIPYRRLKANPESPICVQCLQEME